MNILDSLKTIFQEVNAARSLPEVLTIIVTEVQAAMNAEVCSVYLFDETDSRYVLMATKGLRQESIGKVRLQMGEGLVGLVAAKEEPLNLQNADKHPNFVFFEEIGEDIYHSFWAYRLFTTEKFWAFWSCSSKPRDDLLRKKRPLWSRSVPSCPGQLLMQRRQVH